MIKKIVKKTKTSEKIHKKVGNKDLSKQRGAKIGGKHPSINRKVVPAPHAEGRKDSTSKGKRKGDIILTR